MKLSRTTKDNIQNIALIAVVWSSACVLFVTFRYAGMNREIQGLDANYFVQTGVEKGLATMPFEVDLRRAYFEFILGGLLGGVLAGAFEILVFPRSFRRQPFAVVVITKILFYIAVLIIAVLLVEPFSLFFIQHHSADFLDEYVRQLTWFFQSNLFQIAVLLVSVVGFLTTVFRQLASRLGQGVLSKIITGKYHTPQEEERVFMFLDMRNSTSIAEHLGHLRFSGFLKDYFYEISDAIHRNGGEIDQYIGDEIVVTWPGKAMLSGVACIQCHFEVLERLVALAPVWQKKYGVSPSAKSGIHIGKVITTEVGVFKQSVVFLGDTVNTAARIQEECNKYHKSILLSGELMHQLRLPAIYIAESVGAAMLRGKEHAVELFSISMRA